MPQITVTDLRTLLDSSAEEAVLYLKTDDEEEPEIDVWAAAYVNHGKVITSQYEAREFLGNEPDEEIIGAYLAELQEIADALVADLA